MDDSRLASEVTRAFSSKRFNYSLDDLLARRARRRSTRRWVVGAGAVVAGALLWALSTSPVPGNQQVVFAGWQPVPTTPDAALADAASAVCGAAKDELPGMRMIGQDQRGSAAAIVFAGNGQLSICLVTRDKAGKVVATASGLTRLEPRASSLSVDSGLSQPETSNFPGLTIVAGRVGGDVSSVEVARADGVLVSATVTSGYFLAWWPTTDEIARVTAKDKRGGPVAEVDRPF
jgi:hypothetical protein